MAILQFNEIDKIISNELQSKDDFDRVCEENEKPSVGAEGNSRQNSNLVAAKYDRNVNTPIIAESPNLFKQRGDSMSNTHINLFRSKETFDLLENDHKAFLLFSYISLSSTRGFDPISELHEAECFVSVKSTPKKCGLTDKEYREAKKRLLKRGLIVEIFNPDWIKKQKSEKASANPELEIFKKRAMKRATKSCIVKMVESDIYDINLISKGNQNGKQRATKGQPNGNIQEEKEYKEVKKDHPSIPSFPKKLNDGLIDDSSSFENKKNKIHILNLKNEKWGETDIFLTQEELDECIKIKGSLQEVQHSIFKIYTNPSRKTVIKDWVNALKKWKTEPDSKAKKASNEELGKEIERKYGNSKPWRATVYKDTIKDDRGVLFECVEGQGSLKTDFISFSKGTFQEECQRLINEKMKKK